MKLKAQDWLAILAFQPRCICSIGEDEDNDDGGGGGDDRVDVEKLVDQKVNAALSNHLGRFRTSFEKDLDSKLGKALDPLSGTLNELREQLKNRQEDDSDANKKAAENEELRKANARIADLEKKNKEAEEHALATERQRLQSEERTALSEALSTAGVDKSRLRAAVALLYGEDKRVKRDQDGNIVFAVPRAGYVDEAKLEEGIADWLKSEEGKAFLPATGAAGSGSTGSRQRRNGKKPITKDDLKAEARRALLGAHGIRVPD